MAEPREGLGGVAAVKAVGRAGPKNAGIDVKPAQALWGPRVPKPADRGA